MRRMYYILPALLCLWLPGKAQVVTDTASIEVMLERAFGDGSRVSPENLLLPNKQLYYETKTVE